MTDLSEALARASLGDRESLVLLTRVLVRQGYLEEEVSLSAALADGRTRGCRRTRRSYRCQQCSTGELR